MPFPRADAKMEVKLFPAAAVGACPDSGRRDRRSLANNPSAVRDRRDSVSLRPLAAFTLIELLVVLVIIAVLMGLAFPVFQGVQNQAKRTQAKNDLMQIVTAVNAYYTEYGMYPLTPTTPADTTYGATTTNEQLFNELRSVTAIQNPRGIVFLSPPDVKDVNNPRAGISSAPATAGQYFDPWGIPYLIRIDTDYDNQVNNPYSQNAGSAPLLRSGVIAWSFGMDALSQSTFAAPADKNTGTNKDDVISWQ
jgi:prepilin-type N-terminal cleavage/methylation domain-containing protein